MDPDRNLIDPAGTYPADGFTQVESFAVKVLELLPEATFERTRDVFQIDWKGERGIVVVITPETMELRLPTIEWTMGAYGPAPSSRLWKRVKIDTLVDKNLLKLLLSARDARVKEFLVCRYCKRELGPERMHDDVCHGCAEKHLGIVH
jgi:hypothetical protein